MGEPHIKSHPSGGSRISITLARIDLYGITLSGQRQRPADSSLYIRRKRSSRVESAPKQNGDLYGGSPNGGDVETGDVL